LENISKKFARVVEFTDDFNLDYRNQIGDLVTKIKESSCFQVESAYAKIISQKKFKFYAFIKYYRYYPGDRVEMTLRFNEKVKQDEFNFTYYQEEKKNITEGNRLLGIFTGYNDIITDDLKCAAAPSYHLDEAPLPTKDGEKTRVQPLTLCEQSGFLYRDKAIYVSMSASNLKAIHHDLMGELVRTRSEDGRTEVVVADPSGEKSGYEYGLDHSFRYYECLAVNIVFSKDAVEVGLVASVDDSSDVGIKHAIESEPIQFNRIFYSDPSGHNIINFPRPQASEGAYYRVHYRIVCEDDKGKEVFSKRINESSVDLDPYTVAFTPYIEDDGRFKIKDNYKKVKEGRWCWPSHVNAVSIDSKAIGAGSDIKCSLIAETDQGYSLGKFEIHFEEMHSGNREKHENTIVVVSPKHGASSGGNGVPSDTVEDEIISPTYVISFAHESVTAKTKHITIAGDKKWAIKKSLAMDYVPRVLSQSLEVLVTVKKAAGVSNDIKILAKLNLFQFDVNGLKIQLVYGTRLLLLPGVNRGRHKGKSNYWVKMANDNKYSTSFVHPETYLGDVFRQEQRVTYSYHKDLYPGTVRDIIFTTATTMISVDLDRGDQGRKVSLAEVKVRPDLLKNNFDEKEVFEYDSGSKNFKRLKLGITNKEFNSLQDQKEESWIKLPESIYGAATCFIIVNHEKDEEVKRKMEELEAASVKDPIARKKVEAMRREQNENRAAYLSTFFMLLAQIVFTFLMQGVLIWYVWVETPDPSGEDDVVFTRTDGTTVSYSRDSSGFCSVNPYLQVAAIAVLTIWTVSTFTDIFIELRCYISRAMVLENAETGELRTIKTSKQSRLWYFHGISFCCIMGLETIICIVVFVAGMKYVLNLEEAADIVGGVLAITFVTDIDNKVYEISAIEEGDDSDVQAASFRVTDTDFYDHIVTPFQNSLSKLAKDHEFAQAFFKEKEVDSGKNGRNVIQQHLQVILSASLVLFVFVFVFANKAAYCPDY